MPQDRLLMPDELARLQQQGDRSLTDEELDQEYGGPPPVPSALERFAGGFGRTNPVSVTYDLAAGLWNNPKQLIEESLFQPVAREATAAKAAFQAGRPAAALGHALGAIPLVGPPIASTVERAASGDVAGAAGEGLGLAMTAGVARPTAKAVGRTAVSTGTKIPGLKSALRAGGERLEPYAERQAVQAIAPEAGANRANWIGVAKRLAPDVARDPTLRGAATRQGLMNRTQTGLETAQAEMDRVFDQNLLQTQHASQPVIDDLQRKQTKLVRTGNKGGIIPEPDKAAYNQYQQMIDDVKAMGDQITYEELRELQRRWAEPARQAKIYAKSDAEFGSKTAGKVYASGVDSIREYLASKEPQAAKANAQYALYKNLSDVLDAAYEAQLAKDPNLGRVILPRAAGFVLGRQVAGMPGEIIGSIVVPAMDRAISSTRPGFKMAVSRNLAALADALQAKNQTRINRAIANLKSQVGPMKTSLRLSLANTEFTGDEQDDSGPPRPQAIR